jgi:hypothetical protein
MGALRNNMLPFNEYCEEVKKQIFAYHKIETMELLDSYDEMVEKAESAEKTTQKLFERLGYPSIMEKLEDPKSSAGIFNKKDIINGTKKFIVNYFKDASLSKNGYCLKENVLKKAVQLRSDENMLGIIVDFVENSSRFVMVDFGESEGAVKIDVDELFFG